MAPGAANRSTVMLDGRHERRRGERRARVTRLGSACRELGEREERLELATDVEESGEASRRDARRDGRRVATDAEKRRRLRCGVPSSEQGKRWSKGDFVNKMKFQNSRL